LEPFDSLGWINDHQSQSHDLDAESGKDQKQHATSPNMVRSHSLIACGAKEGVID